MPRVDIHAHILPGLDDGPTTLEDSLGMARMAMLDGTEIIVATPHYRDVELAYISPETVTELSDTLDAALRNDGVGRNSQTIRVLSGMTHRLDTSLQDLVDSGRAVTLNRTRFLLVEPPFTRLPSHADDMIGRLLTQRLVPVIAHPERNREFQRHPNRLRNLVDDGVIVQIASGSIMGRNGTKAQRTAERFISDGVAHVVASEMHSSYAPRSPLLTGAFNIVANLVGDREAINLFELNPTMILEGRSPQLREPDERSKILSKFPISTEIKINRRINSQTQRARERILQRFRQLINRV